MYLAPEIVNVEPVQIPFSDAIIKADFLNNFKASMINTYD